MRHSSLRVTLSFALAATLLCAYPGTALAATKYLNPDGSIPARWNLRVPSAPSDDASRSAAGGDGDGHNAMSFSAFDDGDVLCAFPGTTFTGHAGVWKDSLYRGSTSDKCVWSANTSPANGVQLETCGKYRTYDYCYGEWVPSKASYGPAVIAWCAAQVGEPYDIGSAKTDYTRWYCSKLAWAGWRVKTGVDIDGDGGYWVKPGDVVNDAQTSTFAYSD